jgi:L-ribulose-5-phosphate 3-epimerase
MKKSISIWSFFGEWSLERKFQIAKEAGFSGVEIDLSDAGPVTLSSRSEDLTAVRRCAERNGIELSGLATGLYWGTNPASVDPGVRLKAQTILERQIAFARELGIDSILVVPGSVGVDFIPGSEVVPYGVAWENATAFIGSALPSATRAGVRICIENVWNKFLLSPFEMRSFIEQFDSEFVGAYFDVGNSLAFGYPEHWIPILGSSIKRVHLKDYRRAVGTVDGFVELLSGDVNWPLVMNSLRTAGYSGWLTAEMIPPVPFYKHAPEVLIHNTSRAMDALLVI